MNYNKNYRYPDQLGNVYFDDPFMRDLYTATSAQMKMSLPYVNVLERPDRYVVKVLSPGVDAHHLDISVNGRDLIIVSKGGVQDQSAKGYHLWREFSIPSFVRTIKLPADFKFSPDISYELDKGVLSINLMK